MNRRNLLALMGSTCVAGLVLEAPELAASPRMSLEQLRAALLRPDSTVRLTAGSVYHLDAPLKIAAGVTFDANDALFLFERGPVLRFDGTTSNIRVLNLRSQNIGARMNEAGDFLIVTAPWLRLNPPSSSFEETLAAGNRIERVTLSISDPATP
jgi:hypothetical protein